jgi:2-polyprenyl-3-methyl-5-hydroxy-6-metoxy-1,4-benzoquinol methylase
LLNGAEVALTLNEFKLPSTRRLSQPEVTEGVSREQKPHLGKRARSLMVRDVIVSRWMHTRCAEDILSKLSGSVAIVGNATPTYELGSVIDQYDNVIRLNNFRIDGFERWVGRKTDFRCVSAWSNIEHRNQHLEFSPFTANAAESANLARYNAANERSVLTAHSDVHLLLPDVKKPSTGCALVELCAHLGLSVDLFAFDGFRSPHYWQSETSHVPHSSSELDYILRHPRVRLYADILPYRERWNTWHLRQREAGHGRSSTASAGSPGSGPCRVALGPPQQGVLESFLDQHILEFGAGSGQAARFLESRGNRVTAVDISDQALEETFCFRKVRGGAASLALLDEDFDLFLCIDVLEHLSDNDCRVVIAQAARLCRKVVVFGETRARARAHYRAHALPFTIRQRRFWTGLLEPFFHCELRPDPTGRLVIEGERRNGCYPRP